MSEIAKEASNEKAPEDVAAENPDGEAVEGGFLGKAVDPKSQRPSRQRAETTAEENEKSIHGKEAIT